MSLKKSEIRHRGRTFWFLLGAIWGVLVGISLWAADQYIKRTIARFVLGAKGFEQTLKQGR
jgi:capsule polysaccharide export protein KpsE/RkpR